MRAEVREIPAQIRRTFIELRGNESYRTALEWMRNEWELPSGPFTEESPYLKGVSDCLDLQASLLGMEFNHSLQTQRTNDNDNNDTDGT